MVKKPWLARTLPWPAQVGQVVGEVGAEAASAAAVLEGGMAEVVVGGALLRVFQDLVSLVQLFEANFRLHVARVAIGMELLGEPPVGGLELLLACAPRKAERFIVVALGHVQRGSFGLVHWRLPCNLEIAMFLARGKGEQVLKVCGAPALLPQPGGSTGSMRAD
jgi:hypothetical protein